MTKSRSDDRKKEIRSWLQSESVDRTAEYVGRGRQYSGLQNDELLDAWRSNVRRWADRLDRSEYRTVGADLSAELQLRGIDVPIEDVREEFDKIASSVGAYVEKLEQDPDEGERAKQELMSEIEAFRRKRDEAH